MTSFLRFSAFFTLLILTACSKAPDSGSDIGSLETMNQLRNTLDQNASSLNLKNEFWGFEIMEAIDEAGAEKVDPHNELKSGIALLRKETKTVCEYLDQLEDQMEKIGGVDYRTNLLESPGESQKNQPFWFGESDVTEKESGNGEAKKLKQRLDEYCNWVNTLVTIVMGNSAAMRFESIALSPSQAHSNIFYESKDQSWEYFTFHGKTVMTDLAMLSNIKLKVLNVEEELLSAIKKKIRQGDEQPEIYADSIYIVNTPVSNVVKAGDYFETVIEVKNVSKYMTPEFSGVGEFEIIPGKPASKFKMKALGSFPAGTTEKEQFYKITVKVNRVDGATEELNCEGKFTVRKP